MPFARPSRCSRLLCLKLGVEDLSAAKTLFEEVCVELSSHLDHESSSGVGKSVRGQQATGGIPDELEVYCRVKRYRSKANKIKEPPLLVDFPTKAHSLVFLLNRSVKSVIQADSNMVEVLRDVDFQVSSTVEFKGLCLKCHDFDLWILHTLESEETKGLVIEVVYYGCVDLRQAETALREIVQQVKHLLGQLGSQQWSIVEIEFGEYKLSSTFSELHSALQFGCLLEMLAVDRRQVKS